MQDIENKEILSLVREYIKATKKQELTELIKETVDIQFILSRLSHSDILSFFAILDAENVSEILVNMPDTEMLTDIIEELPLEKAADILSYTHDDEQVDILKSLEEGYAQQLIAILGKNQVQNIQKLIIYKDDTAGGLMSTEYLALQSHLTVKQTIQILNEDADKYKNYDIQYIYVVDEERLLGILPLRELLIQKPAKIIGDIMLSNPINLSVDDSLEMMQHIFECHKFLALPVTDKEQNLCGIVKRNDLEEFAKENSNKTFLKLTGIIGGEEYRSMPTAKRISRRLSWLTINILLNFMAASVIALYQDVLSQIIILAVFIPIISDMSGCSGHQSLAVSLRELSLGLIHHKELLRVWGKEFLVGLINGIILGAMIGVIAFLWQGSLLVSVIIAVSLTCNSVLAVCFGGSIPLLLKWCKIDPAIASGPILTTVTDMVGFLLIFSLAEWLMGMNFFLK